MPDWLGTILSVILGSALTMASNWLADRRLLIESENTVAKNAENDSQYAGKIFNARHCWRFK